MSSYRTLFEIGKSLFGETDMSKLLPLAMDKVIEQTKAHCGMIIVYSPEGELQFQVARDHLQKDIEQPEKEISTTIVQRVRESDLYYVNKNVLEDPSFDKSLSIRRISILSVAGAPLRHQGEVLGVIYVDNRDMKVIFDDESGRLLSMFAELISVAVKNALLRMEERQERQRLEFEAAQAALKLRQKSELLRKLETQLAVSEGFGQFKGLKSRAMLEVFHLIKKAAPTDAPVLILGETGTGKELVARALHNNSLRREQPFIKVNCAGLAENLLESELFGHVKGAFTGANKDKVGYFEIADSGTIFLDEIAKSSANFQTKLLGVLEYGEFLRMGEVRTNSHKTDVRVIAAASPNLRELIVQDRFYLDLFHRLKVVEIQVPPLRERGDDIPELADFFLRRYAEKYRKTIHGLSAEAGGLLLRYHWPGNVRELQHAIEYAVIHAEGEIIQTDDLPRDVYQPSPHVTIERDGLTYAEGKKNWERGYFCGLLLKTNGNIAEAARLAGLDKSNLWKKLRDLDIDAKDFEK
ncbi:MAG: sigma-54 interaction domain-containing protein [bacterium]